MTTPRSLLPRLALCAILLGAMGLSGCAKPRQLGGSIAINQAGLGERVDAFCRLADPSAPPEASRKDCLGEPLE